MDFVIVGDKNVSNCDQIKQNVKHIVRCTVRESGDQTSLNQILLRPLELDDLLWEEMGWRWDGEIKVN